MYTHIHRHTHTYVFKHMRKGSFRRKKKPMDVESVAPASHELSKETTTEQVSKANTLGFIEYKLAQTII